MRTTTITFALATALAAAPTFAQENAVVVTPQAAGPECHSTQIDLGAGPVTVRWGQRAEFAGCSHTPSDVDTDRNGVVSADEVVSSTESDGRSYSSLDRDKDGFIDDPELLQATDGQ